MHLLAPLVASEVYLQVGGEDSALAQTPACEFPYQPTNIDWTTPLCHLESGRLGFHSS